MRRKKWWVVTALMLALGMTACAPKESAPKTTEEVSKDEAKAVVKEMKGEELVALNEGKEKDKILIVDVRPEKEYLSGHIPNAINILSDDMESKLSELEDFKDKPVIVYCNTGKRSAQASDLLVNKGFQDVSNAQGVKEFSYDLVTYHDIRAEKLLEMAKDPDVVLVDYRPKKLYDQGHIDGALHIDLDTLKDNVDKLPKDKKIVLYCNTGTKSALGAKELSEMGYTEVYNSIEGTKEYDFDLKK